MNIGKTVSLAQRREDTLAAIESFCTRKGRAPSYAELASLLHCGKTTVCRVIASLREEGLLGSEYDSTSIVPQHMANEAFGMCEVPCVASISCGVPEFAEQGVGEMLRMVLPQELRSNAPYYALTTHGLSMIDTDIDPDSIVLIDPTRKPRKGNIIVALVDGETTLKRFYPCDDGVTVELRPENQQMESIYVNTDKQSFSIQGVAVMMQKLLI